MKRSLPLLLTMLAACGGAKPAEKPANAPTEAKVTSTPNVTPDDAKGAPSEDDSPIPIAADDTTWGSRTALVTMVEMTDLQCPFCARAHATVKKLQEKYGPDQLRVVWKHEPLSFHPYAREAAEWEQGVFAVGGSNAAFCFIDRAYSEQADIAKKPFAGWARACNVDASAVEKGVNLHTWSEKVERDMALAKKLDVNGTPTFFINGIEITGAQPFDKFAEAIDDQIGIAKQLLEKGAPREKLYVVVSTVMHEEQKKQQAADDDDDEKEDTKTVFKIPVGDSPQRGPATAPVTIVEFSDFQCPFCKRVEDTLAAVRAKYGDKVRFVWKDEPLPFHPRAEPAAELAREARAQKGDAAFWDAHDRLFASNPKLEDADLEAIAKDAKLDVAKVKAAIASHKHQKKIDADASIADDFQANGTPHFFINGRRLVGAQPEEKFDGIIDEELKHAQEALARGAKPEKLYDELIKDGKGAPPLEAKTVAAAANAPARGPANAQVTVQEFADFQCPFCQRTEETLATLLKEYPGKVKIVWRNLPLPMHPDASLAAQAAMEAYAQKGNLGFWKMHDLLFAHQKDEGGLKRDALDGYARECGLDMKKWAQALESGAHAAELDKDKSAAMDAKITGTPSFVINGYYVAGAQPAAKFRKVVNQALSDATKH